MLERISSVYTHIGANNMYPIYSTPSLKKNTIERENGGPACTYKKWKGVCTTWVWTVWALFVATMRHYRAHCVMGQHRRSDGRERELGNNNKSIYREKRVGYLGMKHETFKGVPIIRRGENIPLPHRISKVIPVWKSTFIIFVLNFRVTITRFS
jgi:hypothetical protein